MFAKPILKLLATLLVACAAHAAVVEDRSPFRQGHWWDPSRSGHGFELLSDGAGNVFVVWYTYDDAGEPTWYTAQGTRTSLGAAWPLQKHRWAGGRISESTTVGSLGLEVDHFEKITATWQVGAGQGRWSLEPFVHSAILNEVDLTGHWYNPAQSGWGMTLVDQGDVFGAVIYAYDPAGAPTWVAGFDRGKGRRVALYRTRGTCPSCTYAPALPSAAGFIDIEAQGDSAATIRGAPSVPFAAGIGIDGAATRQLGRPGSARTADYQLVPYGTEAAFKAFLAPGLYFRYPDYSGDRSTGPSLLPLRVSVPDSRHAGTDEADILGSGDRFVYAVSPMFYPTPNVNRGHRKVRIAEIGAEGSSVAFAGELPMRMAVDDANAEGKLLVHGDRLVTLSNSYHLGGWYSSPAAGNETQVEIFALDDPAQPRSLWRARLAGRMVANRRVDDRLYVVTRFSPSVPGFVCCGRSEERLAATRLAVDAMPLTSLLPWTAENGAAPMPAVSLASVYAPQLAATDPVADMLVVTALDLRQPRIAESLAILGRVEAMQVSSGAIYLSTQRLELDRVGRSPRAAQPALYNSDVHLIRIGADAMGIVGSAPIQGTIGLDPTAPLRFGTAGRGVVAVSKVTTGWRGEGQMHVDGSPAFHYLYDERLTVLEPSDRVPGLLRTVASIPNAQRPEAVGKPGSTFSATRFTGNRLYAVTWNAADPLYVFDLANPSDPRFATAVAAPDLFENMYPIGDGLMLGFGRNRTPEGYKTGLQFSLFDLTGHAPRQIDRMSFGMWPSDSPLFTGPQALAVLRRADGSKTLGVPAAIFEGLPIYGNHVSEPRPWRFSGLLRFEVRVDSPAGQQFTFARTLVSNDLNTLPYAPRPELSGGEARSILYPGATVYVSGGKFFHQDAAGKTTGPY